MIIKQTGRRASDEARSSFLCMYNIRGVTVLPKWSLVFIRRVQLSVYFGVGCDDGMGFVP